MSKFVSKCHYKVSLIYKIIFILGAINNIFHTVLMLLFCIKAILKYLQRASFQINTKLYVFQKDSQSWIERGRGLLRLNDMSNTEEQSFQSRLGAFYSLTIIPVQIWCVLSIVSERFSSIVVPRCHDPLHSQSLDQL